MSSQNMKRIWDSFVNDFCLAPHPQRNQFLTKIMPWDFVAWLHKLLNRKPSADKWKFLHRSGFELFQN